MSLDHRLLLQIVLIGNESFAMSYSLCVDGPNWENWSGYLRFEWSSSASICQTSSPLRTDAVEQPLVWSVAVLASESRRLLNVQHDNSTGEKMKCLIFNLICSIIEEERGKKNFFSKKYTISPLPLLVPFFWLAGNLKKNHFNFDLINSVF